jgi:hypothetical protein
VILLITGNIRWDGDGREVAEKASFTEVNPLNVYQSTRTCVLLAALIFLK